ncbi:GDP-fucose synthetase [Leptolyngbya valderiana BDU 20041]|nr:GDP-fucose synthetase [Leptolyngbya valderiana BDU 20041]
MQTTSGTAAARDRAQPELLFPLAGKRVWVAGHRGMVGSAIVRRLASEGCAAVLQAEREAVDLRDPAAVLAWMRQNEPQAVFVSAARVGGILANDSYPVDFLDDNLMIAANVMRAAHEVGVDKLLFLGSSCIYPKHAPQPIAEEALLTGPLEPTNQWYAVAKIAGLKLAQAYRRQYGRDFISAMPTNLYGPGDNFDLQSSHVIPALMRKADAAKRAGARGLDIWGTGQPRREFLHVDDCADALVHIMKHYSEDTHINVGSGSDMTILELARAVMKVVGLEGEVRTDPSKPDGTPRKLMSADRIRALGWHPSIELSEGLTDTYRWYCETVVPSLEG